MYLKTIFMNLLVVMSIYKLTAHKIKPPSSSTSNVTDKCLVVSKCSGMTYKSLFGHQHDPPKQLVTRFHDVMGSITSLDGHQTALQLWSYYIKNVTVCGHLAPALPEFHDMVKKAPTLRPTLMDTILKGKGRLGFDRAPRTSAIKLPLHSSHIQVDPTHPLSKDLKDAINAVLSNHTKKILKKLDVKEETFTYDEIDVELSMIDICSSRFPRKKDGNVTKLQVSDVTKNGSVKMLGPGSVMLMAYLIFFHIIIVSLKRD